MRWLTRIPWHLLPVVGAGVLVACTPASGTLSYPDAWYQQRAQLLSDVCMGAAPTFGDFATQAESAGFGLQDDIYGHSVAVEVFVSLLEKNDTCTCYMTMGAPEQTKMVQTIFETLVAEYGQEWRPDLGEGGGIMNDLQFILADVEVRVLLRPGVVDDLNWIAARAIVPGSCDA